VGKESFAGGGKEDSEKEKSAGGVIQTLCHRETTSVSPKIIFKGPAGISPHPGGEREGKGGRGKGGFVHEGEEAREKGQEKDHRR